MAQRMSAGRRRFIQSAATLAAAAALPEWFMLRESALAEETAKSSPPPATQPKLPVALIGCGGRGQYVCEKDGAKHLQVVALLQSWERQRAKWQLLQTEKSSRILLV